MGGFHSTVIDGHRVEYGDICEVEYTWNGQTKWIAASFVETTEDGDRWFRCVCEDEYVRGDDTFPDYYQEIGEVRFAHKKDDPSVDLGAGI